MSVRDSEPGHGAPGGPPSPGLLAQAVERAEALRAQGRLQPAAELCQRVLGANPGNGAANHLMGLILHQGGRHAEARGFLEKAVEAAPREAIYRSNLGVVLKELGRLHEAVESYEAALAIDLGLAHTRSNLGVALLGLERVDAAIAAQKAALALDANLPEAHANLGLALLHKGETAEAIAAFRRAIALRPDYAFAYNHLAGALRAAGEGAEARAAAERAVALQPLYAAAHNTLGQTLVDLGEREAAVEAFRRALQIRPDAGGYQNLSVTLSQLGRTREAIAAARTGLKLAPDDLPVLVAMADAQASARQYGFALPFLRRAIALRPDDPDLVGRLGHVLVNGGFLHEGVERLRAFYERFPDELSGRQTYVFALNYLAEAGAREIAAEAFRYGELLTRRIPPAMSHANDPDPGRRLRVGFVSGDFENHPVARFLEPTCRSIDPEAFELFAYKTSLTADEMTARLQQLIPNWREVALTRDEALAQMIAADRIDILFDLSGFWTRSRLGVFARKPAPIAVTWLGYFATTGLSTIDYVLASPWVISACEEDQWIEKPWRLPETYLCFARPEVEVPVGPLPMLRNGFLTFGSASNVNKISDRTARCWGALLRAVPGSRLLLRSGTLGNPRVASELRARLEAAGIPGDRLTLEKPVVDYGAHLARYNEIDIALDPFPYAGATTTMEALWMGVPVLTLRGDRYVSHMGENIHHNVGLTDWIADDAGDYVRKATAFAADHEKLGALRDGLRARVEASPMMDAPRFARHFEAALREMWRIWCRDRAAQPG